MQQYDPYNRTLTDQYVLETVVRYGHNAPDLEGVPPSQWYRVLVMLDLIKYTLETAPSRESAIRQLKLNPLFAFAAVTTGKGYTRMVA